MLRLRLLSSFMFLLFAAPAAALELPPAEFKAPPVGMELLWANAETNEQSLMRLDGRDGKWLKWNNSEGRARSGYTLFCWSCPAEKMSFDTAALDSLFPLQIGKQVVYERSSGGRSWQDTVKVTGTDTITIPAGRFDVYVVETTSFSSRGWSGKRVHYYAPGLGWNVKVEREASDEDPRVWHVVEIDGRSGIQASVTAPDDAGRRAERAAAFARQPAPETVQLVPIGEVTGVKTFAYGTVPGATRMGRYVKDTLTSNELLETISGSALHAVFEDGTDFRMGPSAQARLDRFVYDPDKDAGELAVALGKGAFRFVSGKIKAGAVIGTPDVTIGVRGTDFIVEVENDRTRVTVLEGEVEITPRDAGAAVSVAAGQVATATAQGVAVATAAGGLSAPGSVADDSAVPQELSIDGCGG